MPNLYKVLVFAAIIWLIVLSVKIGQLFERSSSGGTAAITPSPAAYYPSPVYSVPNWIWSQSPGSVPSVPTLPSVDDMVYHFMTPDNMRDHCADYGCIIPANNQNWKFTYGQAVSQSLFKLKPMGTNLPHHHPDGVEILFVFRGSIEVCRLDPNAGRVGPYCYNMTAYESTLFPRGHIHFQRNLSPNETAEYISALNSENAGVNTEGEKICELPEQVRLTMFNPAAAATIQLLCQQVPISSVPGRFRTT